MLPGATGDLSEEFDYLPKARLVMAHPPMAHSIFRDALKLIQPAMDLFERLAE